MGLLTETADELGVATISDLEGVSQDLVLYGTTECRQRIDCLAGLEQNYGLEFKDFKSVDPELRYEVLDNGDADLSILFTTDGQLFTDPDTYTILEDDQQLLPSGNVIVTASQEAVDESRRGLRRDDRAGPGEPDARGHAGAERPRLARPRGPRRRGRGLPARERLHPVARGLP